MHLREEVGTVLHCPVEVGVVSVVLVVWLLCVGAVVHAFA